MVIRRADAEHDRVLFLILKINRKEHICRNLVLDHGQKIVTFENHEKFLVPDKSKYHLNK